MILEYNFISPDHSFNKLFIRPRQSKTTELHLELKSTRLNTAEMALTVEPCRQCIQKSNEVK